VLEVFDAARTGAQHIGLSLLLYRLDRGFGHALGIDAAPEAIRRSKNQMHKKARKRMKTPGARTL